jgi:hypothetical protein
MGCGYLTVIMLARGLGPHAYGLYGSIMSVWVGVELIGRLGIPQALGKLSVENDTQAPALEQTGLALSFLIPAIVGALWLSAPAIAQTLQIPEGVALLRLAAIDIPFYGMYFTCDEILGGRRQFGAAAWGGVIYGAGKAAGIALLCGSGLSISGAFIVNIIASVAALLFMAKHVFLRAILPVGSCLPVILRLAMPMGLIALGVQVLLNIDLWALRVLGQGLTDETTGWYVAAVNVAKLPTVVSFVMTAILLPSISRALSRDDTALAQSYVQGGVRFLCVVLVPVCLLCTLTAESLMGCLYSSRYAEGASFLCVLLRVWPLLYLPQRFLCDVDRQRTIPTRGRDHPNIDPTGRGVSHPDDPVIRSDRGDDSDDAHPDIGSLYRGRPRPQAHGSVDGACGAPESRSGYGGYGGCRHSVNPKRTDAPYRVRWVTQPVCPRPHALGGTHPRGSPPLCTLALPNCALMPRMACIVML